MPQYSTLEPVNELISELNATALQFLLIDLDLGMTFMDVAKASRIEQTIHRSHENARRALDTVLHLSQKLNLDEEERRTIDVKLTLLKARLEATESE